MNNGQQYDDALKLTFEYSSRARLWDTSHCTPTAGPTSRYVGSLVSGRSSPVATSKQSSQNKEEEVMFTFESVAYKVLSIIIESHRFSSEYGINELSFVLSSSC